MAEKFKGPKVQGIDTTGLDVIYKVDFNVPLKDEDGALVIGDYSKIKAVEKTLKYLKKHKPKRLIFISHLGKPQKELKKKPEEQVRKELSLGPVFKYLKNQYLQEIYGKNVAFVEDLGKGIPDSGGIVLDNIRFDPREQSKNDDEREQYAKELCNLIDEEGIIVFDAFGAAHRKQASAYDIMKFRKAYAGFLMQDEIKRLQPFINPREGSLAILAGAKIEDKIEHVEGFLKKYDTVLLGGGMVFTFYKAMGCEIGESIINSDMVKKCEGLLNKYGTEKGNGKLILPSDVVITKITAKDPETGEYKKSDKLEEGDYEKPDTVPYNEIKPGYTGVDIGKTTVTEYKKRIAQATMIFWNGPMGVFEVPHFENGTKCVGLAIEQSNGEEIGCGGQTLEVISKYGLNIDKSTGGGAASDLVVNGTLPACEALKGNFN